MKVTNFDTPLKVQCISTKSGFYTNLKLGQWYNVVSMTSSPRMADTDTFNDNDYQYFKLENGELYDCRLFRDLSQFREHKLNKILSI